MMWTNDTEIESFTLPQATGTNCSLSYSLTPAALPAGVTRNSFTVSGTPTMAMGKTQYTWTAKDTKVPTTTAALRFHITVKPKAPTGFYLTPMPERQARLSWTGDSSIPVGNRGFVVQVRYPSRPTWARSQHQAVLDAGNTYKIDLELDRVHLSQGLAGENYFEFQVMLTDSRGSNHANSDFSKTVRIFDNPIDSLNGNSAGLTSGKAVAKWKAAEGPITYEIRYREMQGSHSSTSWRPKEATSESDWQEEPRTHNANAPAKLSASVTGLTLDAIYAFQLNYETETILGFSAREAYVWPSADFPGNAERVGTYPFFGHHPNREYRYLICPSDFPVDYRRAWYSLIENAFEQWENATNGFIRMTRVQLSSQESCADDSTSMARFIKTDDQQNEVRMFDLPIADGSIYSFPELQSDVFKICVDSSPACVTSFTGYAGIDFPQRYRERIYELVGGSLPRPLVRVEVARLLNIYGSRATRQAGNTITGVDVSFRSQSFSDPPEMPTRVEFNTCIRNGAASPNFHYETAVHEAGHALGLSNVNYPILGPPADEASHPTIPDAVMNYDSKVASNFREPDCSPYPFDVMAIYALYQADP